MSTTHAIVVCRMDSYADVRPRRDASGVVVPFNVPSPVDRAVAYLQEHYRRPSISLGDVARAAGISRFHLARQLRHLTGRAFLQHLHALRIDEAVRLLARSGLSVKEVAATIGYNDATQFCRRFRRAHGMSPGTFRRRARARIADEEQPLPTLHA
jgi:AraC-like DNA-binding protein